MTPAQFYSLRGSVFGYSKEYFNGTKEHAGQDYPWGAWTEIPSPGSGRVAASGFSSAAGNWVSIQITTPKGTFYFIFYHMIQPSSLAIGQQVGFGFRVGYVGSTGDVTGAHLHLAVSNNPYPGLGTRFDPVPIVAALLAANSSSSAGGGVEIIKDTIKKKEEEEDMTYALKHISQRNDSGVLPNVPTGAVFIGSGTDPLVWVSNPGPELVINGLGVAEWDSQAIAERIGQVGLRGSGANVNKVYASMKDAIANKPAYLLGGGSTTVNAATDPALLTAVNSLGELAVQQLAATKAITVAAAPSPTAAQIAKAVNDDAANRLRD